MLASKVNSEWLDFLQEIISNELPTESLGSYITRARELFSMGSAFVYEADHTGLLHLRDHESDYGVGHLAPTLDLRTELGANYYEELTRYPIVARLTEHAGRPLGNALSKLFSAQVYIIAPQVEKDGDFAALVGFVDRRGGQSFDAEQLRMVELIVSALGSRVRLRRYQDNLHKSNQALEDVLDSLGVDIYVNDFFTHEVLYCNKPMAKPYGGKDKLIGRRCWEALYTDKGGPCDYCPQNKIIDDEGSPTKTYSWDYERPFDKSWWRVLSAAFRWTDGRLAHVVTSVDITENKRNEELVRRLAEQDALTGLPNRHKLRDDMDAIQSRIAKDEGSETLYDIVFFDLNEFKSINDTYGHKFGDELLSLVGEYLLGLQGETCQIYRYGGDEFLIWYEHSPDHQSKELLEKICARFYDPWELDGREVYCGASFGAAVYPKDSEDIERVLVLADKAMYRAKLDGNNAVYQYDGGEFVKQK